MLIHGYGQNGRSDFNRDLKNAFLDHDDYNVIVGKKSMFINYHKINDQYFQLIGRVRQDRVTQQPVTISKRSEYQLLNLLTG